MAVASGGTRPLVERTLELIGVRELFDAVVVADDVPRGKPHPDIFLHAAKLLGVEPESCLVFEDGQPGIVAAERAGMKHGVRRAKVAVRHPRKRVRGAQPAKPRFGTGNAGYEIALGDGESAAAGLARVGVAEGSALVDEEAVRVSLDGG